MKQQELTRAVKEQLWKLFTANPHDEVKAVFLDGRLLPVEAVAKQHALWEPQQARQVRRKGACHA